MVVVAMLGRRDEGEQNGRVNEVWLAGESRLKSFLILTILTVSILYRLFKSVNSVAFMLGFSGDVNRRPSRGAGKRREKRSPALEIRSNGSIQVVYALRSTDGAHRCT